MVTIMAAIPPLVVSMVFVFGFGAAPGESYVVEYFGPGVLSLIGGVLLLTKLRHRHALAALGWLTLLWLAAHQLYWLWQSHVPGLGLPPHEYAAYMYLFMSSIAAPYLFFRRGKRESNHNAG
jgi:hypothetical protein